MGAGVQVVLGTESGFILSFNPNWLSSERLHETVVQKDYMNPSLNQRDLKWVSGLAGGAGHMVRLLFTIHPKLWCNKPKPEVEGCEVGVCVGRWCWAQSQAW